MNNFLRIRIPTLFGLGIIVLGTAAGVILTLQNQNVSTKAHTEALPKDSDIKVTNIEDTSVSITWVTATTTANFVKYSPEGKPEKTKLDDRDKTQVSARKLHHVSLDKLTPATTYQYKIVSGGLESTLHQFTTASSIDSNNTFGSIIGAVLDGDKFLDSGIIYLEIPGANSKSAVIKDLGNFILPLSKMRTANLSGIFKERQVEGRLIAVGEGGENARAKIALRTTGLIGTLKVGQELDFTKEASPGAEVKFDLNNDRVVNASDHSIVLTNFGKNPKVPRADLNEDGVVDRKDVEIISNEIAKLGNQ